MSDEQSKNVAVTEITEAEIAELKGFADLDLDTLVERVFAHPLYLAQKLDGKDIRVCPGDGDIYFGEAVGPEGGVRMSDGGMMMINPVRAGVGCQDQDTPAQDIEDDSVKGSQAVMARALQTLVHCERHPEDRVTKENGREALLRWEARFKDQSEPAKKK